MSTVITLECLSHYAKEKNDHLNRRKRERQTDRQRESERDRERDRETETERENTNDFFRVANGVSDKIVS